MKQFNLEELTEFDKCLLSAFYSVAGKAVMTFGTASFEEDVNEWSKPLLDLARKELKKDWRTPLRLYKRAYEQGKQDVLKSLPKWKKSTMDEELGEHVLLFENEKRVVLTTELYKDEYYLELNDLKNLPKE